MRQRAALLDVSERERLFAVNVFCEPEEAGSAPRVTTNRRDVREAVDGVREEQRGPIGLQERERVAALKACFVDVTLDECERGQIVRGASARSIILDLAESRSAAAN